MQEKHSKRKKGKIFLLRTLLWLVLVALIPVIILSIQGVKTANNINKDNDTVVTETTVENIGNSLTLILDNLSMQNVCIASDKECTDFVNYKNGHELEAETAPYSDPQRTYEYIYAKQNFRKVIQNYLTQNNLLASIYYCDLEKNLVMTSMWIDSNIEHFFDVSWEKNVDWNIGASPLYLPLRKVVVPNGAVYSVVSVVYRPFISTTNVALVYNLDANALLNKCVGKGQITKDDCLFLYDGDGKEIIAYIQGEIILSNADTENLATGLLTQKERFCYAERKLQNNWTVRLVHSIYDVNRSQKIASRSIILVAISTSVFTMVLLFLLVLQMNRPLRLWNLQVQGKQNSNYSSWFSRGTEIEAFGEWLQVSGTALRARFWTQAVMGRIDNLENFKHVHFHITLKDFLLAVVSLDNSENSLQADERILACSTLAQLLRQNYSESSCDVVEMEDDTILVLINCNEDVQNETIGHLLDVYKKTAQDISNASDIAVGGFCATMQDVQECYNRALLLLHYQRITGNLQTKYNPSVEFSLSNLMPRIWEKERNLSFCILHHDYDGAETILSAIRDEMNNNIGAMDYFQIRHRILHLATQIVDDYQQENGTANLPLYTKKDIYTQIIDCDDLDKVWKQLIDILQEMKGNETNKKTPSTKTPVGMILTMLENDCGKDMNLAQLSERIGMSSVYISKAFKQTVGENYTQYLTRKRMEVAKKKLLDKDLRIQDISESLGYAQSHYFSKVFKDYYGLAPREYILKNQQKG